jgi:hypothetical protein
MGRGSKSRENPSEDELMIRVPHDWIELLEAAQFVRRKKSMQALLKSIVLDFLEEVKNQPALLLALKSRTVHEARAALPEAQLRDISKPGAETDIH